jgi:dipeptidyl aminopeptidase/acylaminoacyl peptidase
VKRSVLLVLLTLATAALATDAVTVDVPTTAWLRLGPQAEALPAFHDEKPGGFSYAELLDFAERDAATLHPRAGEDGWATLRGDGPVALVADGDAAAWLAVYVEFAQWWAPTLVVRSAHPVKAWFAGEEVKLAGEGERTAELKVQPGKHLLLLRTVKDPGVAEPWTVGAGLKVECDVPSALFTFSNDPRRAVTIDDVLDAPRVGSLALSPDGLLAALTIRETLPGGASETRLEIRATKNGELVRSWRGALDAGRVRWLPGGGALSYTSSEAGATTMWVYDLKDESVTPALRGVEDFQGYAWNPDGRSLVYSFGVDAPEDKGPTKRLRNIEDRWPWSRDRSYLVEVSWPDGAARRLTAGDASAGGWTFSPDGSRLLFSRSWPEPTERPYSRTEWYELELADLSVEKVLDDRWIDAVSYGPDLNTLVVTASPSAFDGVGSVLPAGVQANDYGGQLFLYDRARAQAKPLSRDFDPAVQDVVWHASGRLIARVLDRQWVRLATCSPAGEWKLLDSGVDVVADWEAATDARTIVLTGTGVTAPQTCRVLDLRGDKPRLLLDPGAERFRDVTFGKVESYAAELPDGMLLDGFVYYPRDYVPGRKYPVIVYYYGGTSPITRDFGGRYPKNVWAGLDYFVYVPNPSGATGYGQEFAARHVNDWGRLTAGEVIEGTRAFLAAHPDADAANMACVGASYGGFLTMYIVTQTDLFRAAVSHAGISNISSYWAEGYWGYSYGARALAHSFPWNDPELYVEQSPLFHADKIVTPLLLLHGFDDTNVPRGESDGLYNALQMLGREVEYVQIAGQDHHILDHDKRIVWNDTILGWFERELKLREGWWNALYPE